MPANGIKDIVIAALIAVPIFYIGGKVIRRIHNEIKQDEFPFEDDD